MRVTERLAPVAAALSAIATLACCLPLGIAFGLVVGLLLAFIVAHLQHGYYLQIMLPGGMVGLIVGYATQKYGSLTRPQRA